MMSHDSLEFWSVIGIIQSLCLMAIGIWYAGYITGKKSK